MTRPTDAAAPAALAARDAYRLWAPSYDNENALTALENRAVRRMTPALTGLSLLDAGCGTGRRFRFPARARPRTMFGIDLVFDMIVRAKARGRQPAAEPQPTRAMLAVADLRALPCRDALFDVVWCRLALGHIAELEPAYAELARVARPGAHVVISDFHPSAARAGHTRSFRDRHGQMHVVENHVHEGDEHVRAARAAGLMLMAQRDGVIGPAVRRYYEAAGLHDAYVRQEGQPFVLVLGFRA